MENNTSYGDFMVKLIWRLSGNLIKMFFDENPRQYPD